MRTVLHRAVWLAQALRRLLWFVTRPRTIGVHGIPLTAEGKVVLVRLSYARGWRLPGGGRKQSEDPHDAMLRELREEIGLTDHRSMELVTDFEHRPDHRRGNASLFIVRGVRYRPRWSLEIADIAEFDLQSLPADTAAVTLRLLALAAVPPGDML